MGQVVGQVDNQFYGMVDVFVVEVGERCDGGQVGCLVVVEVFGLCDKEVFIEYVVIVKKLVVIEIVEMLIVDKYRCNDIL